MSLNTHRHFSQHASRFCSKVHTVPYDKRVLEQNSRLKSTRHLSVDFNPSLICDSERIFRFGNCCKRNFIMKCEVAEDERVLEQKSRLKSVRQFSVDFNPSLFFNIAENFRFRKC